MRKQLPKEKFQCFFQDEQGGFPLLCVAGGCAVYPDLRGRQGAERSDQKPV